ncbi:MAG: biopolymer transporter ExbD [Candidatus Firestonebacteria bacterium]|nr:biopolymer transporter ExbD [Candidatus Firestonebacteria bacterium]
MLDIKRKKRKIFAEINITPLTDVALVLLIIFMITAPLIVQSGIKVKLPGAVSSDVTPERNIVLTVSGDGKIYLGNQELTLKDLFEPLAALLAVSKAKIVIINADTNVAHGIVISAMDVARQAGAEKLFESTEHKKPEWRK